MDVRSDNTAAAKTPERHGGKKIGFVHDDLAKLPLVDLGNLMDAVKMTADLLSGQGSQPRYYAGDDYSPAGTRLQHLLEWLDAYQDAIMFAAEAAKPQDADDSERRAWILIKYWTRAGESLGGVSALAAKLANEVHTAEWHERQRRAA